MNLSCVPGLKANKQRSMRGKNGRSNDIWLYAVIAELN
jgi:hypothetical protein